MTGISDSFTGRTYQSGDSMVLDGSVCGAEQGYFQNITRDEGLSMEDLPERNGMTVFYDSVEHTLRGSRLCGLPSTLEWLPAARDFRRKSFLVLWMTGRRWLTDQILHAAVRYQE